MRKPTRPMIKEVVSAGFYEPQDFPGRYPRLQILAVAELRNRVVRKPAYRPDAAEGRSALKQTREILFPLAWTLRVHVADDNWYGSRP